MQQLANTASSNLDGAINNSVTTLDVDDASSFPATGTFTVLIGTELLRVTGVASNTLTVIRGVEGTTAASHADNVAVTYVLTKEVVENLLAEMQQSGVYASRPSSPRVGTVYTATDINLTWRYDSAGWGLISPFPVPYAKRVDLTGWTQFNAGSTTWTDVGGVLVVTMPQQTGVNIRGWSKALPGATPYTLNVAVLPTPFLDGYYLHGVGFRNSSTGALRLLEVGPISNLQALLIEQYSNPTTFTTAAYNRGFEFARPAVLQIENDGTDWKWRFSLDGLNFTQIRSEAVNSGLTPDHVCLFCSTNDSFYDNTHHTFLGYWEG